MNLEKPIPSIDNPTSMLLLFISLLFVVASCHQNQGERQVNIPLNEATSSDKKYSKYDRIELAMEQEFEMTHDRSLGYIPRKRLWNAVELAKRNNNSRSAISNIRWLERGPKNVGGRTRTVLFDPNDPTGKAAFAASVAGGLWYTNDVTITNPGWKPVNDQFSNMAIVTLTYDPNNPTTMYFGTGEGWFNLDAVRGDGIWKSTDGGTTWSQLPSTSNSAFHYVNKMVVDDSAGIVYATTRNNGLQRSLDGGSTWNKVLGFGTGNSTGTDRAADIEQAANGDLYASMGIFSNGSIYKSTDHGDSWTELSGTGGLPGSGYERVEIALAPSDPNAIIVLLQDEGSNDCYGIYTSDDGGSSWTSRPIPAFHYNASNDFTNGQAWYDLIAAFDPNNKNRIIIGGVDMFISENFGSSWSHLSEWRGVDYQYVHADHHEIYFKPGSSQEILFGNDGGVYYTNEGNQSYPDIEFRNSNFNVTQLYAAGMHPHAHESQFVSGSQDNGSHKYNSPGIDVAQEVTGGDGAFCHIDQGEPEYWFTSYVYNQYRRSSDTGKKFTTMNGDLNFSNSDGRFINPTDYDSDEDLFYAAWSSGQYMVWTNPKTGSNTKTINAGFSGTVSAVTCDPHVTEKVWFGDGTGKVYKVTNASANNANVVDVTDPAMPGAYLSCIAVDPSDQDHILATYSSYGTNSVWESTDNGSSWQSVEGNLPDMPVRWALFNPKNGQEVLLATETGVWSTNDLDGTNTDWGASNTGLATVRVDMLQYRSSDNLVIAATHGRGLYSSDIFTSLNVDFGSDRKVAYTNKEIQFYDNSYQATSWNWDFGDGNTSTVQNPNHSYTEPGKYDVTLTINSGAATITKDTFIHILPNRSVPYKTHFGGNMEVNYRDFGGELVESADWQRGSSSVSGKNGTNSGANAWITSISKNTYPNLAEAHLLTPNFDFSASGNYNLSFYTKYDTEQNWDGFQVQYSTNKGDGWVTLGSYPSFYNTKITSQNTAFLHGEPFFSGQESNYTQYQIDVSSLAGNANVAFRFVFKSDQYVEEPGVAIDDINVSGPKTSGDAQLVISQYREPSGSGAQGIELWNIAGTTIDFSEDPAYIYQYSSGSSTPVLIASTTSGTLDYGKVMVIGNSAMQTFMSNNKPGVPFQLETFNFSGDDALEVVYKAYANDQLGKPGNDPGTAWTGNGVSTADQNIGLKPEIFSGDTNGWSDPSLRFATFGGNTGFGDPPATVYDGSQWTWVTPDATTDTVNVHLYAGNVTWNGDVRMQHFVSQSGTSLDLSSGSITINGDLNNQGNPLYIAEDASLVMTDNNAAVSGEITTKRTGTQYNNIFNYWSTPVTNKAFDDIWTFSGGGLTFNSADLYTYDGANQQWQSELPGNTMTPGEGIAITGPVNGGTNQRTFTGTPNNGAIAFNIYNNGGQGGDDDYNLIGNPYPCAIDAQAFLQDAENNELAGSIWYWDRDVTGTHKTEDYAQWTLTGGLCPSGCAGDAGTLIPDEFIPAMQGFMVEATSAGDGQVQFKNDFRVRGNNDKFFKSAPIERVWMVARQQDGPANGILIGFSPLATEDYDRMYDGRKLKGNPNFYFTTMLYGEDFAIQGLPPLNGKQVVPVKVYASKAGQYSIGIDTIGGLSELVDIHLVNTRNQQQHDLRQSDYVFSIIEDDQAIDYLEVHFNGHSSGLDPGNTIRFSTLQQGNRLQIRSNDQAPLGHLTLINVHGQMIYQASESSAYHQVQVGDLSKGIYFLQVEKDGKRQVKRIFL